MGRKARDVEPLLTLFKKQKVLTLPEMMAALRTESRMTVFRSCKPLGYRSSYSHRGSFYTLDLLAQFDEVGLWKYRGAHFSKWGTLNETAEHLVDSSSAGYLSAELDDLLRVPTKEPLLALVQSGRVAREPLAGRYLYCSASEAVRCSQLERRNHLLVSESPERDEPDSPLNQLRAGIVLFLSTLNEKQRRLYAGLEALKLGRGGDKVIAGLLSLDPRTVARGRRELESGEIDVSRVRARGGGRPPVEKKLQK